MPVKVCIVGASQPAVALAIALAERGVSVTVFGDPEAVGVASGLGPRFMWATAALELRWPAFRGLPRSRVSIAWSTESPDRASVYRMKSRGVGVSTSSVEPCRGVSSFEAYDGLYSAGGDLAFGGIVKIPSSVRLVRQRVDKVWPLRMGGFEVESVESTQSSMCDALVTALPPGAFRRLYHGASRVLGRFAPDVVSFLTTDRGPDFSVPTGPCLVYNGSLVDRWHRASRAVAGGSWCYEVRGTVLEPGWVSAATQLVGDERPQYPAGVVPIGRQAEWDGELMVTDVAERIDSYVETVMKAAD